MHLHNSAVHESLNRRKLLQQKVLSSESAPPSSTDTPNSQNDSEDRSKAVSSIQQGIRQAEPTLADQQQALRGYVYGAQNDEVAFRKAAKAIKR
jgi:hypothetical protein